MSNYTFNILYYSRTINSKRLEVYYGSIIREISIKDVENFIQLLSTVYDESEFTLYNPGEYAPTIQRASKT